MSIFKKYDSVKLLNLSSERYKLYFPYNKPLQFNKILQKIVLKRLDYYIQYINRNRENYDKGELNCKYCYSCLTLNWMNIDKNDYYMMIQYCKRCSIELIYNTIRKNYNYCSIARLDYIISTSLILSMKMLFGVDGIGFFNYLFTTFHPYINGSSFKILIKKESSFYFNYYNHNRGSSISRGVYIKMEMDILNNENYNICRKVRLRIGDIV
jgi:hypothetical protein